MFVVFGQKSFGGQSSLALYLYARLYNVKMQILKHIHNVQWCSCRFPAHTQQPEVFLGVKPECFLSTVGS